MNTETERKLAARASALGASADASAFGELAALCGSVSPLARRLAASSLGKLAGLVSGPDAVAVLTPLLGDAHPQVRQYAAKALGGFGPDAETALPDLRDLYRNAAEKDYVKRSVKTAGKRIRESIRIAAGQAEHRCRRCHLAVAPDEYARSQRAFQRAFCDVCFDTVFLERRNWETHVELNKTIQAADGAVVQSQGECRIADRLAALGIAYRYDNRFRIVKGYAIRPDFYLPEHDVYIEYWGLTGNLDYQIGMLEKKKLYQQAGKRLISIYPRDLPTLDAILSTKLARLGQAAESVKHGVPPAAVAEGYTDGRDPSSQQKPVNAEPNPERTPS